MHSALMEAQAQNEMLANAKRAAILQKKIEVKEELMLQRKEQVLKQRILEVQCCLLSSHINLVFNERNP